MPSSRSLTVLLLGAALSPLAPSWTASGQEQPSPAAPAAEQPPQETPETAPAATEQPETPAEPETPPRPLPPVAVTIDGDPIFVAEVNSGYEVVRKSGTSGGYRPEDLKAGVLDQLIDRRLAEHALERDETLIDKAALEKQMENIAANVKKQGFTLDQFCEKLGITPDTIRKDLIGQLATKPFLERNLADDLESYFKKHQVELDGTELRASHILLEPNRYNETKREVEERAERIRAEIQSGKIDFATAARKYSVGPSREQGGDLGFIPRHGVMLEEFGEALFQLKPGEISRPLTTPLGTHLITVTGSKPGGQLWTQVIPQIQQLAARVKMKELIAKERETAKIEFTGKVPYYDPATKKLVAP